MNTQTFGIIAAYLVTVVTGLGIEKYFLNWYYRLEKTPYKKHHFTFGKYVMFLMVPFLMSFYFLYSYGMPIIFVFITFAIGCTILEWGLGYSFHKIVGMRLWTYNKYSIGGYTSFLSIPFWGLTGVLFYLIARLF